MKPQSAVVLGYHSVSTDRTGQAFCVNPGITSDSVRFQEHMQLLNRYFSPITLDDLSEWLHGNRSLPRNAVVVTFDDGFADNAEVAASIMEEFGIFGTFYLTVDAVRKQVLPWFCQMEYLFQRAEKEQRILRDQESGQQWNFAIPQERRAAYLHLAYPCARLSGEEQYRHIENVENVFGYRLDPDTAPKMMTFEQARQLQRRGHIIGCHSYSHGNMAHIPGSDLQVEIAEATKILSAEMGEPIRHFSYPHPCLQPQWNEESIVLTREIGFETAVLTNQGAVSRKSFPHLIPRLMCGNEEVDELRWRLEAVFTGIKI